MQRTENGVDLVLIAENPARATMLRDTMRRNRITGVIRRLSPSPAAIDCGRKAGAYANKSLPDLIVFDYSEPTDHVTSILQELAFSNPRSRVPVVLLTSPSSQDLLDAGDIDGDTAVMFSPTSLVSFVRKMQVGKRQSFFRALDTLYQYGPILVRIPEQFLGCEQQMALSA